MTTKAEQERNLINLRRAKVAELLAKGWTNQAEIARTLNVSEPTISRDITYLNQRSRETFDTYLQKELPTEFNKAITTFDYVIRTATHTAETTHDDKIKLQALHEVREARTAKMDLISNHDVMAYQVNKNKEPVHVRNQTSIEEDTDLPISGDREEEDQEVKQEDV